MSSKPDDQSVSTSPESSTGTHGGRLRRRHVADLQQRGSCRLFAARSLSRRLDALDARSRRLCALPTRMQCEHTHAAYETCCILMALALAINKCLAGKVNDRNSAGTRDKKTGYKSGRPASKRKVSKQIKPLQARRCQCNPCCTLLVVKKRRRLQSTCNQGRKVVNNERLYPPAVPSIPSQPQ